ncbi:hypothetical protein HZH68_007843 [Vespula germanica]|uniref:Uncharacterized protein n=1 Tax=Vespula germanica TaxID=30212 RepID=A0A834K4Y0_VESGE|nr:hypothetical protein HZH68_007843 [Vespula germanica]
MLCIGRQKISDSRGIQYSPLRPLSSATVAVDSGVGGGSGGGSSSTRSSSSSSSSNVGDGCWWSRRYQLERKR